MDELTIIFMKCKNKFNFNLIKNQFSLNQKIIIQTIT